MNQIIYDARKVKAYECISKLCSYTGHTKEWTDDFWTMLRCSPPVYDELVYYLDHGDFLCRYKVGGCSIIDIFIWQMREFNIRTDRGKNGTECDKLDTVLLAFHTMLEMEKEPELYQKRMGMDKGMDL